MLRNFRTAMIVLIAMWGVATCAGCVTDLKVGSGLWSAGIDARCLTLDGCTFGVEVSGWRVGFAVFPDVGPVDDEAVPAQN